MNKKIYLIVVLAIVITTLSETVSIISGDHGFYQTVQDKCTKCHGDVKVQLSTSVQHSSKSCTFCHVRSVNNHTNTVPDCQDCHETLKLNDTLEAHTGFAQLGSEGCIACHTTYNAIVNYSRAEYIDYYIQNNSGTGEWTIIGFTTIGSLNLSYNANRNGGNHNWKNVLCEDCHQDIFDAVSVGGHAVVFDTNGTQVLYHSNANSTLETWCRTCHSISDTNFTTQQHAARRTTCDDCHQAHGDNAHPGNFYTNIKNVPHLYRSLVCIACKKQSGGWINPSEGQTLHFTVHEEPYYDVVIQ